jgi:hypothetical protein
VSERKIEMSLFLKLLSYLPQIINTAAAIKVATGSTGSTATHINNAIQAAVAGGEAIPDAHVQAISALVGSTVSQLEATGLVPSK